MTLWWQCHVLFLLLLILIVIGCFLLVWFNETFFTLFLFWKCTAKNYIKHFILRQISPFVGYLSLLAVRDKICKLNAEFFNRFLWHNVDSCQNVFSSSTWFSSFYFVSWQNCYCVNFYEHDNVKCYFCSMIIRFEL